MFSVLIPTLKTKYGKKHNSNRTVIEEKLKLMADCYGTKVLWIILDSCGLSNPRFLDCVIKDLGIQVYCISITWITLDYII